MPESSILFKGLFRRLKRVRCVIENLQLIVVRMSTKTCHQSALRVENDVPIHTKKTIIRKARQGQECQDFRA